MDSVLEGNRKQLEALVQSRSESILRTFGSVTELRTSEPLSHSLVFGHRMSLIMVSNAAIRVTFSAHFNEEETQELLRLRLKNQAGTFPTEQVLDYFKEYCNVVAGALKVDLKNAGLETGISLPLATRGFDELFFPPVDSHHVFAHHWAIHHPFGSFHCTVRYQILNPSEFQKIPVDALKPKEVDEDSAGEMELL